MNRKEKTAFGKFLVKEIQQAKMSQEEFYNSVGIKKPYFYNLLTETPPPPDLQVRIIAALEERTGIDIDRRIKLYDLAAQGRNEIPTDISKVILDNPNRMNEIRLLLEKLCSDNKEI